MSLLEKNLSVLKNKNRRLADEIIKVKPREDAEIILSKTGLPVPRINNRTLHSLFDPVKEGEKWAAEQLLNNSDASEFVVVGFGFGYHLYPLLNGTELKITVVEPNPALFRLALENCDLTSLLPKINIALGRNIRKVLENITSQTAILAYGPSRYFGSDFFDATIGRLRFRQSSPSLKIILVSPIYGGSLPITYYCASALKDLGMDVELVDFSSYDKDFFSIDEITSNPRDQVQIKNQMTVYLSYRVLAKIMDNKPDLVLFIAQSPCTQDLLKILKERKIPTAFWFVEDFRLFPYWQSIAPLCDYFFTIQKGEFYDNLKKLGIENYHYLPTACHPPIHNKINLSDEDKKEYGSNVSFMGAGYGNRRKFFNGLIDINFKIWGNDWNNPGKLAMFLQREGKRVSTEDTVKVFNASKININLHSSPACDGVDPLGDFINPRTFELAGCGAFQLTDSRKNIDEYFLIGEELICFSDLEDLREKINYYLNHPKERKEIAMRAQERIFLEHTYNDRMEELLGFLFARGFQPQATLPGERCVKELITEAGCDTELGEYLSKFPENKKITLNDLVVNISKEKGDLCQTEKMFLLLNDFQNSYK